MATMPSRQAFLQPVLDSLKHQVDHLYVYCNFPLDTDIPHILYQDWITIQDSRVYGDLGCTGRFHFAQQKNDGYIFLVDDDIVYSNNYVNEMISGIERFSRKAVLSCHGGILPNRVIDFTSQRQLYDFEETVPTDRVVNIVGLGVCGFHSNTLKVSVADFPSINRDDLWFAVKCQKERIPLVVLGRRRKLCNGLYDNLSLWKTEQRDRSFSLKQTQIAQTMAWKIVLPAIRPGVSILISSNNDDPEPLKSTLRSVSALSLRIPVELVVSAAFTSTPASTVLEETLHSLRDLMEVKLVRVNPNRGVSACLRAGLNECRFDLVTMVPAGMRLTPDCISRQQRYISGDSGNCLIECTPDGQVVTDRRHSGASVYMSQRHVLQAIDAITDSDHGWDETFSVVIRRLVEHQLPVIARRNAAQETPDSCDTTGARAYSVFAPLARRRPIQFLRT